MSIVWKGIMPAVTTKFKNDDTLDLKMFEVNIKAQLEAGVHGIVLGGTLGEASTLDENEKRLLTRSTIDIVKSKVPVLMNVAEQSTKGAIKAAQQAEEARRINKATVPARLAEEKQTNPFLRCEQQTVIDAASQHSGEALAEPAQIFAAIRQWKASF